MSVAVCDPKAFYPLRDLVEGPFTDLSTLNEIERFVRTVVLHDEISMELEPWPYDPDSELEYTEEEQRSVVVAVGPVLTGYDFFTEKSCNGNSLIPDIKLSSSMIEVVRNYSNTTEGNVYYQAHIEYLKRIINILQNEGSALLSGNFGSAAIDASSKYPEKLFENMDQDWQQFAREVDAGECGFMVPPVLSIILTRCARRDAIPNIIKDLRDEWTDARAKVWELLGRYKTPDTIIEMREIKKELEAASRMFSPAEHSIDTQPVRVLWDLIAGGVAGATTAFIAGGRPGIGAVIGVVGMASKSVPPLFYELGPALFGRGTFDLAKRVRKEAMRVEYDALAKLLTDDERYKLGI